MIDIIIYALIFVVSIYVLFFYEKKENKSDKETKKITKPQPTETKVNEEQENMEKQIKIIKDLNTKAIVNHFRETARLKNFFFSHDGQYLTFHDDKKFCLVYLKNLLDRNIRIYSKSVDTDVIAHVSYSEQTKTMAVGLTNSKELLFYVLQNEDPNNKNKLKFIKQEQKKIKTERKYDIKNVAITNCGDITATSGSGQDTVVQLYNTNTCKLISKIDINEIENKEMKFTPDNNFLTVSTSMFEISCIAINKESHHIKNSSTEEIKIKVSFIIFYNILN
jgi:WD40 repeat protein